MESTQTTTAEDIRDLRGKTEEGYVRQSLKSSFLGGYEKNSVLRFIGGLRDAGQKERETFYRQLKELTSELDVLKKAKGETERKLGEASLLQEKTLGEKDGYHNELLILRRKTANQEEKLAEFEKACGEYERKVESMTVDYEEFQAAEQTKKQYDSLLSDYRELAESRDESIRRITVLEQSAGELSRENEKLSKENEVLGRKYGELLSCVRNGMLQSQTHFGEYEEKIGFSLNEALEFTEKSLKNLQELKRCSEEFGAVFQKDFETLREG